MIQRYYVSRPSVNTEEDDNGEWVKYEDTLPLLKEIEFWRGIQKELKEMGWLSDHLLNQDRKLP